MENPNPSPENTGELDTTRDAATGMTKAKLSDEEIIERIGFKPRKLQQQFTR